MTTGAIDKKTCKLLERLVEANFAGRDELYAAADTFEEELHQRLCGKLGDRLGGNAAEIQQILLAHGVESDIPEQLSSVVEETFSRVAADQESVGVFVAAQGCEADVHEEYEQALREIPNPDLRRILARHRDKVVDDGKRLHEAKNQELRKKRRREPAVNS